MLLFFLLAHVGAAEEIYVSGFSDGVTNGWRNVKLSKGLTDYSVKLEGTNRFVHAEANSSCSALIMKLDLKPAGGLFLRWRWRINSVATNGSEHDLSRFDHVARVFVAFDTFIGPPRTLNYFWANTEKIGSVLEHPMSGRAAIFVVESGNEKAGNWISEERDLAADWLRAFPGRQMPEIEALGILTDGDSLNTRLLADYAGIELFAK